MATGDTGMADVGRVLGGRYRLLELLGEGGMATIYRAHDTQLGRDVAVKVLRSEYGNDPSFVARFKQEAQAAAALSHPSVVAVYDYGTDEAGPFIVMEMVEGRDLAEILAERGALPITAAARIAEQVAEGLAAAHGRGMIHRDVKPGNILVRRDGRAQIGDFGIVRALSESELTLPGTTLGSVHYFSPEQARGDPVTERSDLYSLGLVLYEMLTGRRAFEGDSAASVAMARLSGEPPAPSQLRADVPPSLDAIVGRALARAPAGRFGSARAFADGLRAFLDSRGAAPQAPAGAAATPEAAAPVVTPSAPVEPPVRSVPRPRLEPPEEAFPATEEVRPVRRFERRAERLPPPRRTVTSRRELVDEEEDEDGGSNVWAWAAAALGLVVLLAAGFLAFLALSGGPSATPTPSPTPGANVIVPNVVGMSYQQALETAQQLKLGVSITGTEPSTDQPPGTVLQQDPAPFQTVSEGTTIEVVISSGAATVTVPNVVGMPEAQAIGEIIKAKLEPGLRTEDFSDTIPEGSIISTTPRADQQAVEGTEVDYVVSLGPEPTPTPSPTPVPTPTPSPTPSPTPVPTPPPTEPPTPTPVPTDTPTPTP